MDFRGYGIIRFNTTPTEVSGRHAPDSYSVHFGFELLFDTKEEAEQALARLKELQETTGPGIRAVTIGGKVLTPGAEIVEE